MHLLIALLLYAAPATTPEQAVRATVVKGLDRFDESVTEFNGFIETRFAVDSEEPRTGLAVTSEDMDAHGLHPIIVTSVIRDSPADTAGVMPGDRVLRVGPRRIEHETAQVFRIITDGTAGPLELALLRDGQESVVILHRTPIACLQRTSARIDQTKWKSRVADLRRLSGMVRAEVDDTTITPAVLRLRASKDHLAQLFSLFDEFTKALAVELAEALARECTFRTK